VGITVAKVSEAQVMADAGLQDIFIAYPLVTDSKIRRAVLLGATEEVRVAARGQVL
jgi:D-serine deaminase-like pyridoxal phosphate-dependent protein